MKEYDNFFLKICNCKQYTSGYGKMVVSQVNKILFRVKQKVFPTKRSSLGAMEQLSQPRNADKYQNHKSFDSLGDTGSRNQLSMEVKLHKRSDTMFEQHKLFPKDRTP